MGIVWNICDTERVFLVAVVASAVALALSLTICLVTCYVVKKKKGDVLPPEPKFELTTYEEEENGPAPGLEQEQTTIGTPAEVTVVENDDEYAETMNDPSTSFLSTPTSEVRRPHSSYDEFGAWTLVKPSKEAFKALDQKVSPASEFPVEVLTKKLNRHLDCLPNPKTAVQLSGETALERYINANYVHSASGKDKFYICAQGPLQHTVEDFWKMIVETNVRSIVMMTGVTEKGAKKCERYWPEIYNSDSYGKYEVESKGETMFVGFRVATLEVRFESKKTEVKHFWFDSWKDHSVPKNDDNQVEAQPFLELRRQVRQYQMKLGLPNAPILVHCSAGIGRSGSFIALDFALEQLEREGKTDLLSVIDEIRNDRLALVQHDIQYAFIQKALKHEAANRKIELKLITREGEESLFFEKTPKKSKKRSSTGLRLDNLPPAESSADATLPRKKPPTSPPTPPPDEEEPSGFDVDEPTKEDNGTKDGTSVQPQTSAGIYQNDTENDHEENFDGFGDAHEGPADEVYEQMQQTEGTTPKEQEEVYDTMIPDAKKEEEKEEEEEVYDKMPSKTTGQSNEEEDDEEEFAGFGMEQEVSELAGAAPPPARPNKSKSFQDDVMQIMQNTEKQQAPPPSVPPAVVQDAPLYQNTPNTGFKI